MKRYTRQRQLTDLWSVLRQPGSGWVTVNLTRRFARVALQERTAIPYQGGSEGDRRVSRKTTIYRYLSVTDDGICGVAASRVKAFWVDKIVSPKAMNTWLATIKRWLYESL